MEEDHDASQKLHLSSLPQHQWPVPALPHSSEDRHACERHFTFVIDRRSLLADLRRQLRLLERDLAERAEDVPAMAAALEAEYRAARQAERTGDTFSVWRAG